MPATQYVVGLECDLSVITDVAVQEAVFDFAAHLGNDNEHGRALEHLSDLLGSWATTATATAAISGEYGNYIATLAAGRVAQIQLTERGARARFDRLRRGGIKIVCPHATAAGDPLLSGRTRHKLAAISAATRDDVPKLVRALASAGGNVAVIAAIYSRLTALGGPAADDALLDGLLHADDASFAPVIVLLVRRAPLLARLPDALARAWIDGDRRTIDRLDQLIADMSFSPEWLAAAPPGLAAEIERRLPPTQVTAPTDVDVGERIDDTLLTSATTGDVFERYMAVKAAGMKRKPRYVPTFVAALAHPGNAIAAFKRSEERKDATSLRQELYGAMSFHESPVVRDRLLAGLRDEVEEVAGHIIYIAYRQERLIAMLPEIVRAASQLGNARYAERLRELVQTHG
jgi:hypothetical protein